MSKKLALLSLMFFGSLMFADDSTYVVKSGMLACHERSLATKAFSLVVAYKDPNRNKNINKLLEAGKCLIFAPKDQFLILEKHTKGKNGIYLDYLKIRKIKDYVGIRYFTVVANPNCY